jgi:uncharacterized LabA/DUF88 family protein
MINIEAFLCKELTITALTTTAIFVDVQNIYYTTRDTFGRPLNYRQFYAHIAQSRDITLANAYAIARNDDGQHKFQGALRHIGFDVKLKPFIERSDGSAKGDWDVGITIDVLEAAPNVDDIILLSGDGDFAILLDKVSQKYNCKTTVYGVEALTANGLIHSASKFIPITTKQLI